MGINLGSSAISTLYLGSTEISKAYLGSNVIYEGGAADPEAGLSLTGTYAIAAFVPFGANDRTLPQVFAFDVTGLDGSSGGNLLLVGAAGRCMWIGHRADGSFIVRTGDGNVDPSSGTQNNVAVYYSADGTVVDGDGTLVVEARTSNDATNRLGRVWWNGVLLGNLVSANDLLESNEWAGSGATGKYMDTNSPPTGETSIVPTYTTASTLRSYENQVSSI